MPPQQPDFRKAALEELPLEKLPVEIFDEIKKHLPPPISREEALEYYHRLMAERTGFGEYSEVVNGYRDRRCKFLNLSKPPTDGLVTILVPSVRLPVHPKSLLLTIRGSSEVRLGPMLQLIVISLRNTTSRILQLVYKLGNYDVGLTFVSQARSYLHSNGLPVYHPSINIIDHLTAYIYYNII